MFLKRILLFAILIVMASCSKTEGLKPVVIINNLNKDAAAGDIVGFDINTSAFGSITQFKVEENNNNTGYKTLLDSTLQASTSLFQKVYYYKVPADAVKGQPITLQFTFTNDKGNSNSTTRDMVVKGAQPIITLTSSATEGKPGTAISLHATITSSENDLGKAKLVENINSQGNNTLDSMSWSNQNSATWDFVYKIPTTTKTGDGISLTFIVTNQNGIVRSSYIRINVK